MNQQDNSAWAEAKRRCRLSAEDVRMAKELGFKPKSLMKNIPSPSQKWKAPVRDWVRDLYEKKIGSRKPAAGAPNTPPVEGEPKVTLFDRTRGFLVHPPQIDAKPARFVRRPRKDDEDSDERDVPF